jgi:hypothetical protein
MSKRKCRLEIVMPSARKERETQVPYVHLEVYDNRMPGRAVGARCDMLEGLEVRL